ncbi:hypothetical protein CHGG_07292 [Chaetomium globosum CBS 148.51]|uniref:Protein CASP n=1 Tax=Chaetomium globosum (strain ATCC 6205 / CBS 148.51 / DSM 1962 / NBRC 6347 / NRRL 1970) TaxID=306901 RepID=Q2GXL2_CHAGB|nr:uncharacterized protein CHGG_07292 [Chaetomium globosum CBS 148.51]EAQ86039.1 hypothetical protein CHGG_07292 [Chaetomium globosum CBS 148.51]
MAERTSSDAPGLGTPAPPSPTADSSTVNKFQNAISQWRSLDFTTLVSNLDNTASEIVAFQRDSTVQRKDLAQKTKDFRKLDDASKLTEIKGLLKAYQTFIDLLTTSSKSVNSAFLHTYTSLSDAPDPYPLLEASVDSILVSEDTLPKLTQENQHLQDSVSRLTTQLDDTEARLQTERDARKKLEANLESKVKEAEESWTAVVEEKQDNWSAKEKALEDKIENQDRLLNEIKASYEVNQRLGKSDDADEGRGHVTSAELEMVHSDLERTSTRLAEVEARNEQLRLELAQAKSQVPIQASVNLEDEPGYLRVRSENSSLIRKLDAARVEKEGLKRDLSVKLRGLEREVGMLKDERDGLKAKVQKWGDYDEVKQELEVLKSIEFSTGDDDETRDIGGDENGAATSGKGDTLEQLLLARNKKLSDELTILRVSHQDLQSRLQNLQEELSRTNAELEKSQNLNEKLENELSTVQAEAPNAFPSGRLRRGYLPQRDRFKKRNTQLEQELFREPPHPSPSSGRRSPPSSATTSTLYEKTRYVSHLQPNHRRRQWHGHDLLLLRLHRQPQPHLRLHHLPPHPPPSPAPAPPPSASTATARPTSPIYHHSRSSAVRESAPRLQAHGACPSRVVYSVTRMVLAFPHQPQLVCAVLPGPCIWLVFGNLFWVGAGDADRYAQGGRGRGWLWRRRRPRLID